MTVACQGYMETLGNQDWLEAAMVATLGREYMAAVVERHGVDGATANGDTMVKDKTVFQ